MSCPTNRRLCDKLIISDDVTFVGGNLVIDLPAAAYNNNQKYCIVVAQTIPATATITAPVVITIGGDTTVTYPLIDCECNQVTACAINTRTRYSTCVKTDTTGGTFKLLGKLPCSRCADNLASIPAPTA
jgi:hypothetical protein